MEMVFPGSKLVPLLICSTVRAAGGFNSGTSAMGGFTYQDKGTPEAPNLLITCST